MLESIYVGMSGLMGYSRGLRVIANNTANMNTPGFKGATLQFSDMFYSQDTLAGGAGGMNRGQLGFGLNTYSTTLNFTQGELRQTGRDLDLAIDGQGLFMLRSETGEIRYTRAGQFEFDAEGRLVNRADKARVLARGEGGALTEVDLSGHRTNPAQATSKVTFQGNLSSTAAEQTVGSVRVLDATGAEHLLTLKFSNNAASAPGLWGVTVLDGTAEVATGELRFVDGVPAQDSGLIELTYTPQDQSPIDLVLDFTADVTSFASGNLSTLTAAKQDGYQAGALTSATFDSEGFLVFTYTNGQTAKGVRLALGRFDAPAAVGATGDNQFEALDERAWRHGLAGDNAFGSVRSGMVEISNVNLSQEFSDLVIMQRGYQAVSQVVSTANEMLQQLFGMKPR
jgi:flagellar hook protein FlgE